MILLKFKTTVGRELKLPTIPGSTKFEFQKLVRQSSIGALRVIFIEEMIFLTFGFT